MKSMRFNLRINPRLRIRNGTAKDDGMFEFRVLYEYPAEYPALWTGANAERGKGGCNPPPRFSQMPRLVRRGEFTHH